MAGSHGRADSQSWTLDARIGHVHESQSLIAVVSSLVTGMDNGLKYCPVLFYETRSAQSSYATLSIHFRKLLVVEKSSVQIFRLRLHKGSRGPKIPVDSVVI